MSKETILRLAKSLGRERLSQDQVRIVLDRISSILEGLEEIDSLELIDVEPATTFDPGRI